MFITVTLFALLVSFLNSISFFSGLLNQKPGEVYLGTIHYYEDYFFYLSHFFQGAHGAWLTANRYTSEVTQPSFLFWPNVLLGKIGGLFGLSPIVSYNLSIIVITFIIIIISYLIFRRVFRFSPGKSALALIISTTATSFMNRIWVNGKPMWYPFQLWKTPNFAFDRLGGVPHQLVQTLLFLLLLFFWFSKQKNRFIISVFLIILLTSLNPVMGALFLGAAFFSKPRVLIFIGSLLAFFVTFYFYSAVINTQPHVQSKLWEVTQNIHTTVPFLFLSLGPIVILALLGVPATLRRKQPIDIFSLILLLTCYMLIFTPIPNMAGISNARVLFPALYIFWAALAVRGMERHIVLFILFFLLTIPTLYWEIGQKLTVKPEERTPLLYLPTDVYQGFFSLHSLTPPTDVVLANPLSHMDVMVPALSGHTGYTGHPFATINSSSKRIVASQFYGKQMSPTNAQNFLNSNHIKYVLFTRFDGDETSFQKIYPFLNKIFSTTGASIWKLL